MYLCWECCVQPQQHLPLESWSWPTGVWLQPLLAPRNPRGREEGREEGKEEGKDEGREEERLLTQRNRMINDKRIQKEQLLTASLAMRSFCMLRRSSTAASSFFSWAFNIRDATFTFLSFLPHQSYIFKMMNDHVMSIRT